MLDVFEPAGESRPLTVSELIARLREMLVAEFAEVTVEGEIGSLYRSGAGHLYFDLKDPDAQLRSVLFRRSAGALAFIPDDGMQVRARGRIDIYPDRGALQLIVETLEPCGEGALRRAFEQMRARLEAEGLFDPAHKKPLPFLPQRIGLVTSTQGAAIHDFLRGLRARFPAVDVLVCHARVQGEGAWREVVRALHLLAAQPAVEVIVMARGGGSIEDLWTFNQEEVVRAVFELETPVVSAIGHEVDVVLTDLVADARAATPTHAAECVVPDASALQRQLRDLDRVLRSRQRALLELWRQRLQGLRRGLIHPAQRMADARQRLRGARARLFLATRHHRERASARLRELRARLPSLTQRGHERRAALLANLGGRLDALSPLAVLGRGYSITRRLADGAILKASTQVEPGEGIRVRLAKGGLRATVTERVEE